MQPIEDTHCSTRKIVQTLHWQIFRRHFRQLPKNTRSFIHIHSPQTEYITVNITNPKSQHTGHVFISPSKGKSLIHVLGMIDRFNGYVFNMEVNSITEMFKIICICQKLLEYQPDDGLELEYVRIPDHMLDEMWEKGYINEHQLNFILSDYIH